MADAAAHDAFELFKAFNGDSVDEARAHEIIEAAAGTDRAAEIHNAAMRWAIEKKCHEILEHLLHWEHSEADPAVDENDALRTAVTFSNLEAAKLLVEDGRVEMDDAIGHILTEGELNYQTQENYDRAVQIVVHLLEHCPGQDTIYRERGTYETLLGEYNWARWSLREAFSEAALLTGTWQLRDEDFGPESDFCRNNIMLPEIRDGLDVLGVAVYMTHPGITRYALDFATGVGKFDAGTAARAWYNSAWKHCRGFSKHRDDPEKDKHGPTREGREYLQMLRATSEVLAANAEFREALRALGNSVDSCGWLRALIEEHMDNQGS